MSYLETLKIGIFVEAEAKSETCMSGLPDCGWVKVESVLSDFFSKKLSFQSMFPDKRDATDEAVKSLAERHHRYQLTLMESPLQI